MKVESTVKSADIARLRFFALGLLLPHNERGGEWKIHYSTPDYFW
jgi:hypothetical protein